MKVTQISRAENSDYVKTFNIVKRLEASKESMSIPDLNKPRLSVRNLIGESIPLRDEIITKLEKKNLVAHSLST